MKKGEYNDTIRGYQREEQEVIFTFVSLLAMSFYTYYAATNLFISSNLVGGFSPIGLAFTGIIAFFATIYYGTGSMIFLYLLLPYLRMKERSRDDINIFYKKGTDVVVLILFYSSLTVHLSLVDGKITILSFLFSIVSYLSIFIFELKINQYEYKPKEAKKEERIIKTQANDLLSTYFPSHFSSLRNSIHSVMENKSLLDAEEIHDAERFIKEDIPNLLNNYADLEPLQQKELQIVVSAKIGEVETYFEELANKINIIKKMKLEQSIQVIDRRLQN